jgi:hypothetical protein
MRISRRTDLCENSEGDDTTAGWLHKVRTGSGSDRVVSEMLDYAGHYIRLVVFKNSIRAGNLNKMMLTTKQMDYSVVTPLSTHALVGFALVALLGLAGCAGKKTAVKDFDAAGTILNFRVLQHSMA